MANVYINDREKAGGGNEQQSFKKVSTTREEFVLWPKETPRPRSKARVEPFDVETTYAKLTSEKKCHGRKYHGPDSPLYSAIYPVVCITKVFGLAPYDFKADQLTAPNVYLVFSFAFVAIYCHIMYIVYLRFVTFKRHKLVLTVVETTKVVVNFLVAVYELVWTIFTRRAFCELWNRLQDYDEKIGQLGYPRQETSTKIGSWVLLLGQAVIWTLINQSGMYAFMETWVFNVSYMCVYVGTAVSVFKFFGIVCFLGQRFHQLNRIARENLPPRHGYKSSIVSRQTIQDMHNELMLFGETLGSLYSWSMLFWLGNLSVHSVSNLYFIFDWLLLTPWSNVARPLIFNMCWWLIGFIAQILALHVGCDYTITEANSMGAILVEWDGRVSKRFPNDDTARTSLHFLNRRLHFSAGGLFNVNMPLLCSMVGVLSTYLIILLQFPA